MTRILVSWELERAAIVISVEQGPVELVYMDPDGRTVEYQMHTSHELRLMGVTELK